MSITLKIIGHVESELTERESAWRHAYEGAPGAWLVVLEGPADLRVGDEVFVLTRVGRLQFPAFEQQINGENNQYSAGRLQNIHSG